MATQKFRTETIYGITSLSPEKADPPRLLALNRNHGSIENRLHWIRDVIFDEDRCPIRRGASPQVMVSLRNLAIALLRIAGAPHIAQALRFCGKNGLSPRRLIGLNVVHVAQDPLFGSAVLHWFLERYLEKPQVSRQTGRDLRYSSRNDRMRDGPGG